MAHSQPSRMAPPRPSTMDELVAGIYAVTQELMSWDCWLEGLCVVLRLRVAHLELQHPDGLLWPLACWPSDSRDTLQPGMISRSFGLRLASGKTVNLRFDRHGDLDSATFQKLAPHLIRGLELMTQREERGSKAPPDTLQALSEAVGAGVLVVNCADLRVVSNNSVAMAMVAQMSRLKVEAGQLVGCDSLISNELHRAVAEVASLDASNGRHLTLEDGETCYSIMLHRQEWWERREVRADALAVLLITANGKPLGLRTSHLVERYGFSPKEARAALGLMRRLNSEELASLYGVSIHTVRTQIKSAMKKAGVSSQAGLVSLLSHDPRTLFVERESGE